MELLMQQLVSLLLVNWTEPINGQNQSTHKKMQKCRVMTFGIEDWGTVHTNGALVITLVIADDC
jgi:hypothetical protein